MKTLVLGASGNTGKHVVEQLLSKGEEVKAMVRASSRVPDSWSDNPKLELITGNISKTSVDDMVKYISDCHAVVSSLGHNLSFKGLFLPPRKLVRDAIKLVSTAVEKSSGKQKIILMNTAGNSNRSIEEPIAKKEEVVMSLIRTLIPPHSDNEQAADYLRLSSYDNWVAVRPDTLTKEDTVTEYELYESPIRSAIFNPGKTSRINVANFMMRLITDDALWNTWKGKMPVIYNKQSNK